MPVQRVKNITSGKRNEMVGVRELQARIRDLVSAAASKEALEVAGDAADELKEEVIKNAKSVNVPHEVYEDIFTYRNPPPNLPRNRPAALVGIRKRGSRPPWGRAYVEWKNRAAFTRVRLRGRGKNRKVVSGGVMEAGAKVGESLATMWEMGTSKMDARPFFRPAILAMKARIVTVLSAGYRGILERHAAK